MADELTISGLRVAFAKTNCPSFTFNAPTLTIDVAGTQWLDNVQSVGTTEEALVIADVAAGGYVYVQNMDPTNFVSIRQASAGTNFIKLLAGEFCLFRLSPDSTAPFIIADTAACNVRTVRFDL